MPFKNEPLTLQKTCHVLQQIQVTTVIVSLQLWHKMSNKKRALNNELCDNQGLGHRGVRGGSEKFKTPKLGYIIYEEPLGVIHK